MQVMREIAKSGVARHALAAPLVNAPTNRTTPQAGW